jgi:hypothetical protein
MRDQKNEKKRKNTLFVIDDSSGETIFNLDNSMQKFITVIRHLRCSLWLIAHATTGILACFLRSNIDILLLGKISNRRLLENIWEEYLSLHNSENNNYIGRDGYKQFLKDYIELNKEKYKIIYLDCRNNFISFDAGEWFKKYSSNDTKKIK